jgi:hypothetical protein
MSAAGAITMVHVSSDGDMNNPILSYYSGGVGDSFRNQAKTQLEACMRALHERVEVTPVWNKSFGSVLFDKVSPAMEQCTRHQI